MTTTRTAKRRTQAERRAATRGRLLDAAVACLVERGYGATTTAEVCRRAGASKGALVHHYPTKADLLAGAVEHLFVQHLETFRRSFARVDADDLEQVFAALWGIYSGPTLAAYQELVVAARHDAALCVKVTHVNARFTQAAQAAFREVFGVPAARDVEAETRLVLAVFDGLALNHGVEASPQVAGQVLALFRALMTPILQGREETP